MSVEGNGYRWLLDNDPKLKKSRSIPKKPAVRYGKSPLDGSTDTLDVVARRAHEKTYRKFKRERAVNGDAAHCLKALWLMDRRDFAVDQCLFFPGSHPGFPQKVRYNCRDMAASRAMCIMAHGLPEDETVFALHSCGHGHLSCVNPKHLRWGNAGNNYRDAAMHSTAGPNASAQEKISAVICG